MPEFQRSRQAPAERFAGESHVFDLGGSLAALRAEPHRTPGGHRQVTLFHRSPITYVLFDFEVGGGLKEHSANGLVTIHVLEGRLKIEADGRDHDLGPGQVLMLNPNVPHDVRALEVSAMLLTVHLERTTQSTE
jgi:quercetin dioxygenase-like cupin family protein